MLSSRQDKPLSRAYSLISSLVKSSKGRTITALDAPGSGETALIPHIPLRPVPRKRFSINVSALSLALCATATAAYPSSSHKRANQEYRSSLAAISTLIPWMEEYSRVSKSAIRKGIPRDLAHSPTKAASASLSSPLKWKLQCANARGRLMGELRKRSAITMESIPPLTASKTAPPSGSDPSRHLSKRSRITSGAYFLFVME